MTLQLRLAFPAPTGSGALDYVAALRHGLDLNGSLAAIPGPSARVTATWLLAMTEPDMWHLWSLACSVWSAEVRAGQMSQQTADKYARESRKFFSFATAEGARTPNEAAGHAVDWITAGVGAHRGGAREASASTQHLRRAVVQVVFTLARSVGVSTCHPTLDLDLPDRVPGRQVRPLTPEEIDRCQAVADSQRHTRTASAFALSCCGAATGEVGLIAVADIKVEARTIELPGTSRTESRTLDIIGDWELEVLAQRIEDLRPLTGLDDEVWAAQTRLAHSSRAGVAGVQSAICMTLGDLLRKTGLRDARIRPASIQAAAAAAVFDANRDITAVAAFLGVRSLDQAAATIGWDWANTPPNEWLIGDDR